MIDVNSQMDPRESCILNVDDYQPGRYARTKLLRQVGFSVIEAASGAETLELVDKYKPTLILLDVNLPDMSGFDVCKAIRKMPAVAATTILHISSSSVLTKHQVYGLNSGADGYLVEPIEPSILIATVNSFIRARRAEESSRKAAEELRWFSYRVGHDLSGPLRTITAYAELLKRKLDAGNDPQALKYLDFIATGAVRMRSFMDGLLHYTQSAGGESPMSALNSEELLARSVANLDSAVQENGVVVTHDPLPSVVGSEQLEHVFQNLIANAIKYRRAEVDPRIHVSAREQGNCWVFSVKDNGIGIDHQYHESIFEIFQRLHNQDVPGNGIGLALSKKIIEAHGGTIWVESTVNVGSTFYFKLPSQRSAREDRSAREESSAAGKVQ
jgi:two-component system, sensor histidine kinase and response regulator